MNSLFKKLAASVLALALAAPALAGQLAGPGGLTLGSLSGTGFVAGQPSGCTGTFVQQSTDFFARLVTPPTCARKRQYNDLLISPLVTAGVFAKCDPLYAYAASDQATALTNLASSSFSATATNSPIFVVDVGFQDNSSQASPGTSFVNTNANASSGGTKATQNSAAFFAFSLTSLANDGGIFGVVAATTGLSYIEPRWSTAPDTDKAFLRNNNFNASSANPASTDATGFWATSRTAAGSYVSYKDGASLGTTTAASEAPPNSNFTFLAERTNYWRGKVAAGGVCSGLTGTEITNLYNAVYNYVNTVAGGVAGRPFVAFEGDSLAAGNHSNFVSYPETWYNDVSYSARYTFFNNALPARTFINGNVQSATAAAPALNAKMMAGSTNILCVQLGINEFEQGLSVSQTVSNGTTYLDSQAAAGWRIVVVTLTPANEPGFEAWRQDYNSQMKALAASRGWGIADFGSDAIMGNPATLTDATYYIQEGVGTQHYTPTGMARLEQNELRAAIRAIGG